MPKLSRRKRPGLLPKDESPIKLVPRERREFWQQIPSEADIGKAPRYRAKWSEEEVKRLIRADPAKESYKSLSQEMGRSPGALHWRRDLMIRILRGEPYALEYVASNDHKRADWRQVHKVLKNLGYLDLPVVEQFSLAVHLQQPSTSWRGDYTQTVLKEKKVGRQRLKEQIKEVKNERQQT